MTDNHETNLRPQEPRRCVKTHLPVSAKVPTSAAPDFTNPKTHTTRLSQCEKSVNPRMDTLGWAEEMVARKIRDGKLKARKCGKRWLTTVEWLEDYLTIHGGGK